MGEVLLAFSCMLLYGFINFLGGILVRKTIIDKDKGTVEQKGVYEDKGTSYTRINKD